jgi:hypothetical protein
VWGQYLEFAFSAWLFKRVAVVVNHALHQVSDRDETRKKDASDRIWKPFKGFPTVSSERLPGHATVVTQPTSVIPHTGEILASGWRRFCSGSWL